MYKGEQIAEISGKLSFYPPSFQDSPSSKPLSLPVCGTNIIMAKGSKEQQIFQSLMKQNQQKTCRKEEYPA